jgi:RHS repeat-associated protein
MYPLLLPVKEHSIMTYKSIQQTTIIALLMIAIIQGGMAFSFAQEDKPDQKTTRIKRSIENTAEGIEKTGNAFALQQNFFKYNEINLSHGNLEISESDLKLPGKNGLDLKISRQYNSKFYRSNPDLDISSNKHNWGGWMGHGWRFGFAMRAFVVRMADKSRQRIIIDINGQLETFDYITGSGVFQSTSKDSFKKVSYNDSFDPDYQRSLPSKVTVLSDNGKQLVFSQKGFVEIHQKNNRPVFEIVGLYLTEISDFFSNTISIHYESFDSDRKSVSPESITHIIGNCYDWLNSISSNNRNAFVYYRRPCQIIDTCQRTLTIHYAQDHNQSLLNKKNMISGISYINTNGNQTNIHYAYDESGNLIAVQKDDLPCVSYSYQFYTPNFKWVIFKSTDEPNTVIYRHVYPNEMTGTVIQETNAKFFQGHLLNTIQTPLGARITYDFDDCLVRGNPETTHENNIHYIHYPTFAHATFPVVVYKEISGTDSHKEPFQFYFNYPRDIRDHIAKTGNYVPSNIKNSSVYYFQNVHIDYPDDIMDEYYQFNQGLPEMHSRGIYTEKTLWDFNDNKQEEIQHYQCDQLKTRKVFHDYDEYNNCLGFSIYVDDQEYIRETYTYVKDYAVVENNLLHLIKTETTRPVATDDIKSYEYAYTTKGKIQKIFKKYSKKTIPLLSFSYFTDGRLKTKNKYTAGGQHSTTYTYSDNNQEQQVIRNMNGKISIQAYEPYTGKKIWSQDANTNRTSFVYDDYGRMVSIQTPDKSSRLFVYAKDLKSISQQNGNRCVSRYYDNMGRLIQIDYPNGEYDIRFEYYYGQKIKTIYAMDDTDSWQIKKQFTYDSYLRPTEIYLPEWGSMTYAYDDINHQVSITDINGRTTQERFDSLHRSIEKKFISDNSKTQFSYDAFNNITVIKDAREILHESDVDAFGNVTDQYHTRKTGDMRSMSASSQYFDTGELMTNQQYDIKGNLFKAYSYGYDAEGRITSIHMDNQVKEQLRYDQENRENGLNHLTQVQNESCLTQFDYDANGRVIQQLQTINDIQKTYTVSQNFNELQKLASITFNDKKKINYTYDNHHRLWQIYYDNKKIVSYDYYPNHTIKAIQYANGCRISYTYERDILLKRLTVMNGDGKVIYYQAYRYDHAGRLEGIDQKDLFQPQTSQSRLFSYNTKDEIVRVQINDQKDFYQYAYDSTNNRIRFNYPYDDTPRDNFIIDTRSDRLLKRQFPRSHIEFSYDATGNLIQKQFYTTVMTEPVKTLTYQHNYQGMLSKVYDNGSQIARYEYDTQKQRIFSEVNGQKKIYHWDLNGHIIGEGTDEKDYLIRYINFGNQKLAMIQADESGNESIYYCVNNIQGTPILMLDDSGAIVQRLQMDAFGNVERLASIFDNAIFYTGKKYDPETGLYYFHHRYYDPALGRFISEDPAMQFINPYTYADNNPLRYVDPDGEFIHILIIGAVIGYVSHGVTTGDWVSEEAFWSAAIGGVASVAGWAAGGYALGIQGSELFAQIGYGITSGAAYGATQSGLNYIVHTDKFNLNDFISHTTRGAFVGGAIGGGTAFLSNVFDNALQKKLEFDVGSIKLPTKNLLKDYNLITKDFTVDEICKIIGQKAIGKVTFDVTYKEILQKIGYYTVTQLLLNDHSREITEELIDKRLKNDGVKVGVTIDF